MFSLEEKFQATVLGPLGWPTMRPESEIIERPGWYQVITPISKSDTNNEVIVSTFESADADRIIEQVKGQYRANGSAFKWCIGPWTKPGDMVSRLAGSASSTWFSKGMCCDTETLVIPGIASSCVKEVNESNADDCLSAMTSGWSLVGEDIAITRWQIEKSFSLKPRTVPWFVAYDGALPVGTACLVIKGHFAYLAAAVVLPAYRGKGFYKALLAARLDFLRRNSIKLAVTHAREQTSAPILERLGFETMFRYQLFQFDAE